jgi:hypothetical protein
MAQVSAASVLINFSDEPKGMSIQCKRNALCVDEFQAFKDGAMV